MDGDTDTLTFTITVTALGNPDLVVESPSVSGDTLTAGVSFTLAATVRNRGDGRSAATTLRCYRSTNATISTSDTAVGHGRGGRAPRLGRGFGVDRTDGAVERRHVPLRACVDSVAGQSETANNCSVSVSVSVTSDETGGGGGDDGCVEVNDVIESGEGESCTIT